MVEAASQAVTPDSVQEIREKGNQNQNERRIDDMSQRAFRTTALPIGVQYTEENIKSNKGKIWKRVRAYPLDHPTTDNYEDGEILDARLLKDKVFHIENTHGANAIKYKILGCIDPANWTEIKVETALAATVEAIDTSTAAWAYYKYQVKSSVAATAGKVRAFMSGSSL